jgi:hypothetical protein
VRTVVLVPKGSPLADSQLAGISSSDQFSVVQNVSPSNGWLKHPDLASAPLVIVLGSGLLRHGKQTLRQLVADGRKLTSAEAVWVAVVSGDDPIPPEEERLCSELGVNACCFAGQQLTVTCSGLTREFVH